MLTVASHHLLDVCFGSDVLQKGSPLNEQSTVLSTVPVTRSMSARQSLQFLLP